MDSVLVEPADLTAPVSLELIGALNAELEERYPEEGANHFRLDPEEVGPGRGSFLVARDAESGDPLGCAAVRVLEAGVGEVKRMFVRPTARGRRIGRILLEAIESEAHRLGVSRLVLETGTRQPEAIGLYQRAGFTEIERFGEYVATPLSVCMAKHLTSS